MRRLAFVSVFFLTVVVIMLFVLRSFLLESANPLKIVQDAPDLEKQETGQEDRFLVPGERVPTSFSERENAAAFTLLPSRVPGLDVAESPPIPPGDRRRILRASRRFITTWETFTPGGVKRYSKSLNRFLASGQGDPIISRVDSRDPGEACPESSCLVGSNWAGGSPQLRIVDWTGSLAYVTGYGTVSYTENASSAYGGQYWNRSYALLLEKEGRAWKVSRAVAESTDQLEL